MFMLYTTNPHIIPIHIPHTILSRPIPSMPSSFSPMVNRSPLRNGMEIEEVHMHYNSVLPLNAHNKRK